jgi:hypothetical protein
MWMVRSGGGGSINLVDLDLLMNLITQYYDSFDTDAKSLISLRKIYWPL